MQELLEITLRVSESSIDYPQVDLDSSIWNKENDTYTIKPDVKKKILNMLKSYPNIPLLEVAKEIHIIGSLSTNQYLNTADCDIHIIPDIEKLKKYLK